MPWKKELQPQIYPLPNLRRKWFSGRVVCADEGWSFWLTSSASSRVDAYHYEENGRYLTLGGEGVTEMDVIVPTYLTWDDDLSTPIEDAIAKKILFRMVAAMQFLGFNVWFSYNQGY
jgi:hypothetical protein